jgi:hypothetical protein
VEGHLWRRCRTGPSQADSIYQKFRQCVELKSSPEEIEGRDFEVRGWDVVYGIKAGGIKTHLQSIVPPLPGCTWRRGR